MTSVGHGRLILLFAVLFNGALAAAPTNLPDGTFLEAEDYESASGEHFAVKTEESHASGRMVVTQLFQEGQARYRFQAVRAGRYELWLRYASGGPAKAACAVNPAGGQLAVFDLPPSGEPGDKGYSEFRWAKLTAVTLRAGENTLVLGHGTLRADCFFLAARADYVPGPKLFRALEQLRERPTGTPLPELVHKRRIARHPAWLAHALRPCYAHFEWHPENTPASWCRRASAAGANVAFGIGEMPAGTLDGKLHKYPYTALNGKQPFRFPAGYRLDDGWVKDYVDAAHAEGLKAVIYDGTYRTLDPLLVEHPAWRQQEADGRPFAHGFGSWHSPYRQAYIDRWVRAARESKLDGIIIDMLFTGPAGGDYSPDSVRAFRDRFGVEPPRSRDPRNLTWQRWCDFQSWTREEVLLELTETLHAVDPEIAVIVNQTVGWIFAGDQDRFLTSRAGHCCDGLLEEMGWSALQARESPAAIPTSGPFQNLFLHCRARPGYSIMWHLEMNLGPVGSQAAAYSMLANGNAPGLVTGGNWPEMKAIWDHAQDCETALEGADLVPWLALHFSEDALHWYAEAHGGHASYLENVYGWFEAALETHLPVAIITDDDLAEPQPLSRYAVVVLPNSACLSRTQAKTLAAYVQKGGGLVGSFQTGGCDENGTRRQKPALADVWGGQPLAAVWSSTWDVPLAQLNQDWLDHPDIRSAGQWHQGAVEPGPLGSLYFAPPTRPIGAVGMADIRPDAIQPSLAGAAQPVSLTGEPHGALKAFLARRHGQGKSVFFPLDVGRAYSRLNARLTRRLMERSIAWAASRPNPLGTNAPLSLQTVLYEQGDARIVHLVNDASSFGRAAATTEGRFTVFRDEVLPLHDVSVAVRGEFASAVLLPGNTRLETKQRDEMTEVIVPRVEIHSLIHFRP